MATNLMSASLQWQNRPADERYWSLKDLQTAMHHQHEASREPTTDLCSMKAVVHNGDLALVGEKNVPTALSHWSFNQLAGVCEAPAAYLRRLPVDLAVNNINYGLQQLPKDNSSAKLLIHKNGHWLLRAITSPGYGRIWNEDVVKALTPALDRGWMVPPARPSCNDPRARKATVQDIVPGQDNFGLSVKVGDMIAPAGVYAGDRDLFVFLVNPTRIIDDGNQGLMRGVFIWNSEVGAGAFKVKTFYLENVCGNHIVWGASNIEEIKIYHREGSIRGFDMKTMQKLQAYANLSAESEEGMILAARQKVLGKDKEDVVKNLFEMKNLGLAKRDIEATFDVAEAWEKTARSAPTTLWGFVHGLTRYSQNTEFADERYKLDLIAGKLLELVA